MKYVFFFWVPNLSNLFHVSQHFRSIPSYPIQLRTDKSGKCRSMRLITKIRCTYGTGPLSIFAH